MIMNEPYELQKMENYTKIRKERCIIVDVYK
jgi:hypothetical protein